MKRIEDMTEEVNENVINFRKKVEEQVNDMLWQFENDDPVTTCERDCGYMYVYGQREAQVSVRVSTDEMEWV